MRILKLFGDYHKQPTASLALKEALPILKEHGYNTFFLESPYKGHTVDELISFYKLSMSITTLFPDGNIPKECSPEQKACIDSMGIFYGNLNNLSQVVKNTVRGEKDHFESQKVMIEILHLLKELNIKVVAIDVSNPSEYNKPGDMEKRNQYMLQRIKDNSSEDTKSIVFVGFAHLTDVWTQSKFNFGLLSLILKDKAGFDGARCKSYYFHSHKMDDEIMQDITKKYRTTSTVTMSRIDIIDVTKSNFLKSLTDDITNERTASIINEAVTETMVEYFILCARNPEINKETRRYAESLGGEFIKIITRSRENEPPLQFAIFKLPSTALNAREKREKLILSRCFVTEFNEDMLNYLRENILGLTIEPLNKNGERGHNLTFLDDSSRIDNKNFLYITHADHIKLAPHAIKYQSVIDFLNRINDSFKWRIKFDATQHIIAILKCGHFENQTGAEEFLNEIRSSGFNNIDIYKEDSFEFAPGVRQSDRWHLIFTDLDSMLEELKTNVLVK